MWELAWEPFVETLKETEINAVRLEYHGYSSNSTTLEEAQSYYTPDKWDYLGTSDKMWIDGIKQTGEIKNYFFFRHKKLPLENLLRIA